MFRLSGLLCLGLAILSGSLLFQTSQSVQRAEQDLSEAQNQVNTEKESLRILTAEWDYLNRPERLEKLTLQNLDMDENKAEKASFVEEDDSIPEPAMPVMPEIKPEELYQNVSLKKDVQPQEEPTIENAEGQNFDKLIDKKEGQSE